MIQKYRGITWNIPEELYVRLEKCHAYSKQRLPGTPESEEIFALTLLDEAIKTFENIQRADQMIITPTINVDVSKIRAR